MLKRKSKIVWEVPRKPIKYPKWTVVQNCDTKEYFLILETTKKKFISERAAMSWKYDIVTGSTESLAGFPLNGKIGFRSGTIVKVEGFQAKYWISDNVYHLIATPDFYTCQNVTDDRFVLISKQELEFHTKGDDIDGTF